MTMKRPGRAQRKKSKQPWPKGRVPKSAKKNKCDKEEIIMNSQKTAFDCKTILNIKFIDID